MGISFTSIWSLNFARDGEFFETYDSFRYCFTDRSDDEATALRSLSSPGQDFEEAWLRILLADALFMSTDRHMHNFGVMRPAQTDHELRLAPNFDDNQAYMVNPSGTYSDAMLKKLFRSYRKEQPRNLSHLAEVCASLPCLRQAAILAERYCTS
ncbi:MAG: hypothetical protein IJ083_04455 [Clostridia bacterium]|nr:hypothetical protein [Clostridia bacterium]